MTTTMTPEYWQAAEGIAQDLSTSDTDVNELRKVVSYLGWLRSRNLEVNTEHLLTYLATLAAQGEIRSNQTPRYYRAIQQACLTYLPPLSLQGDDLIRVLGWASRLYR